MPVKHSRFAAMMLACVLILSWISCLNSFAESSGDALEWWQKTNVYEIYVNSFQDTDGNGYGDIDGVGLGLKRVREEAVGNGCVAHRPIVLKV